MGRHPGGRGLGRRRRLSAISAVLDGARSGWSRPTWARGAVEGQHRTGGTAVNGGTLQVSRDENLGVAARCR